MATISTDDTPFRGVSRSWVRMPRNVKAVTTARCTRCGSSLANRRELVRWSTISRVRYEVHVYLCGCGKRREIRRPA